MTAFNIESLNTLSVRLYDHADSITNVAAHAMEQDIRLSARALDKFAHLRFEVSEIAGKTKDPDTARELRDALTDTES